ncbi:HAD-IIB family hydrolase [Mycoplasmopsis lipofaciens]|uniref:HAD-IIB family hydrolase n=1 Tax=Mycoplasmopsis lipofaciens TaxID=114884 RepID=UPI000569B942|nr:HAD-IIB family hydrolase [Mycoplasmopsis lipofaciens]
MNKHKIFAFDLDGTLLTSENVVHPFTQEALLFSQKSGNFNVISTGRGLQKTLPLLKTIKGIDFLICSNGSLFYDVKNKKWVSLGKIDKSVLELMHKYCETHDLILSLDTPNFTGTWMKNNNFPHWMKEQAIMDMNLSNFCSYQKLLDVANDSKNIICQLAIRNPLELANKTTLYFKNKLQNKYKVFLTNTIYTDINSLNTSKWNGLVELANYLKININEIYTFGDSGNDLEMIQNAYHGYCMENGTQDAKNVANHIIGNNNSGTIGETIYKILKN